MFVRAALSSALLGFTLYAPAQSATAPTDDQVSSCPVTITDINPTGNETFGHALMTGGQARQNDGRMFVLKVKNNSGKDIRGMKFQAAYFDATEDTTDIPVSWQWTDPLKADAEKSFRWENNWKNESKVGWRVRLEKVLYDDGSKWEASQGSKCSSDYWRDKKHKS